MIQSDEVGEHVKRTSCHEAGHAIVALYIGFSVEKIEIEDGWPKLVYVNSADKTVKQRCTVLAGGIAGEKMLFETYNKEASQGDRRECSECGGGDLDDYVPAATRIIQKHKTRWCHLRKRLTVRLVEGTATARFDADPNSFELLSRKEIMEIWERPENKGLRTPIDV